MTYQRQTNEQDKEVVLGEKEAKQGLELHEMRYVLAIGTAGAVIALAVVGYILLLVHQSGRGELFEGPNKRDEP